MKKFILFFALTLNFLVAHAQWSVQSDNYTFNAGVRLQNESSGMLNVGVASCYGCYSGQAKPNDGIIRVLNGGDLLLNITTPNIESKSIVFSSDYAKLLFS